MFNKFKESLNEKIKKKNQNNNNANNNADAVSDSTSTQGYNTAEANASAAQAQQQVTFSLNNMAEFSHDELQQVIRKYDAGLQRMRTAITEKTEKITGLE